MTDATETDPAEAPAPAETSSPAETTDSAEPAFLRAARTFYDAGAAAYNEWVRGALDANPVDRAVLGLFAELVEAAGGGPVLEAGSGPGRITGHLARLGVDVSGVDLSPAMVAVARKEYPDLRFDVGTMTALDRPDASLAGLAAWYSTIHIPDPRLPDVLAEFHRVLAPGGQVVLAFQVGDRPRRVEEAFGHSFPLDFHRRTPERMTALLLDAGLPVHTSTVREPIDSEKTQQCYLLARKPAQTEAAKEAGA
jgi:SAM-dependent methyltransferase